MFKHDYLVEGLNVLNMDNLIDLIPSIKSYWTIPDGIIRNNIAKSIYSFCLNLLAVSYVSSDDSILCQHTSSPLGNGAVVETIDNKILVLQRSNNVGEFPGYFVFPGGHPEVFHSTINVLNPFIATL
jgi:hypothetical protein